MALSTKLTRKAPQEPESCRLPESLENSQGPIPAPKINPGKSPLLSHFTKLRMSARINPPNKYSKIGNLIAVPTGKMVFKRQHLVPRPKTTTDSVVSQFSSTSISETPINSSSYFVNLSSDFAVSQPINRSSPDTKSVPNITPINLSSDYVVPQQIDRLSPDTKSVPHIPPITLSSDFVVSQQINRSSPDTKREDKKCMRFQIN